MGEQTLRIDTVNGQKLNEPIAIWVNNLLLPPKQRCVLKGYETGQMIGTSPAEVEAAIEQKKPAGVSEVCWQWHSEFVALIVAEPKTLKLPEQ